LNSTLGFPIWVAFHQEKGNYIYSQRNIFIYLEVENFTPDNLKKLFVGLAAQYPNPVWLNINVYSDKAALRQVLPMNPNGVEIELLNPPDGRKVELDWNKKYAPVPTNYYWAKYLRIGRDNSDQHYTEESYSYSPDPNKEEMDTIVLQDKSGPPQ